MPDHLKMVLDAVASPPVLIDIGASGSPPGLWEGIASHSIYVGFDPDSRDLNDVSDGLFLRSLIINRALTDIAGRAQVPLYLTRSPHCSSTLEPDTNALSEYLFAPRFEVQTTTDVACSTLDDVLDGVGLTEVSWIKTDSQGTDLRLFSSLSKSRRDHVMAVDMEPGLIDAYVGEDLFTTCHETMRKSGFWLSSLAVRGAARIQRSTLTREAERCSGIDEDLAQLALKTSPGWCECQYLRTLDFLEEENACERDYLLLWVFAVVQGQWGFALDVAHACSARRPPVGLASYMRDVCVAQIKADGAEAIPGVASRLLRRLRRLQSTRVRGEP